MKRKGSLLLALLLCVSLLACAQGVLAEEAAVEYSTYTNETQGYSIDYPSNWTLLSRGTIDNLMQVLTSGSVPGIDATAFEAYKTQIEGLDAAMMLAADGANLSVIGQDLGLEVTNELFIQMILPTMLEQFPVMYPGIELVDEGSTVTAGEREFVKIAGSLEMMGSKAQVEQYYACIGKTLYILTFTEPGESVGEDKAEIVQAVLASFVPGVQ